MKKTSLKKKVKIKKKSYQATKAPRISSKARERLQRVILTLGCGALREDPTAYIVFGTQSPIRQHGAVATALYCPEGRGGTPDKFSQPPTQATVSLGFLLKFGSSSCFCTLRR